MQDILIYEHQTIKRTEAQALGRLRYFDGKPCSNGHLSERQVSNWTCCACAAERRRAKRKPELSEAEKAALEKLRYDRKLETNRLWRQEHPKKIQQYRQTDYRNNRARKAASSRSYYLANVDKVHAYNRDWNKRNPDIKRVACHRRRSLRRKADGSFTREQIAFLFRRQRSRCANPACSCSLEHGYHIDHIIALSRGGSNWIRNIQLLCPTCNVRKGSKTPERFMRENGFLC